MKLIADSGSTHTGWCLSDKGQLILELESGGINPFYQTSDEISRLINMEVLTKLHDWMIDEIWFYGAGCSFPEKKAMVADALSAAFPQAHITVESDLLAAARSLLQHEPGIACILGTGSNSCLYDGEQIIANVSPLGFILGDEGSGAVLGKQLVADALKNQLPEWLRDKLLDEYELTPALIMERVYRAEFPNRFLASLTPFLAEHIDEPAIFNLVYDSFESFFHRNLAQYETENNRIAFTGSVAWHFRETLEIVASENGYQIEKIEQNPMNGLLLYHT